MKILFDANISWKLLNKLNPISGECAHVDYIGLDVPAEDKDIWNYANEALKFICSFNSNNSSTLFISSVYFLIFPIYSKIFNWIFNDEASWIPIVQPLSI